MKVLFVGYRDNNHSSAGGYDRIINCPGTKNILGENLPFGFIPVGQRGKFLNLFFLNLYAKLNLHKYDVIHFFYGEMLKTYKRSKRNKIVATVHMKIDEQSPRKKVFIENLSKADAVITLSSSQAALLRDKYHINAHFIPHGFNFPEFICNTKYIIPEKINIVVSGKNYRDVDILYAIIKYCRKECTNVFFHLLGQPQDVKDKFVNLKNVKCYPRLNNDDYYSIIQNADYNFLPVTYATANNALLEASFLGVKSILPSIDGIMDYAAPAPLNIFYHSLKDLKDIFLKLEKRNYDRTPLITYSKKFLWDNIYVQLIKFYESLK